MHDYVASSVGPDLFSLFQRSLFVLVCWYVYLFKRAFKTPSSGVSSRETLCNIHEEQFAIVPRPPVTAWSYSTSACASVCALLYISGSQPSQCTLESLESG